MYKQLSSPPTLDQFVSRNLYGEKPNNWETVTPAPESEPSYEVRAKGKTAELENLLQALEWFAKPCPVQQGFIRIRERRGPTKPLGVRIGTRVPCKSEIVYRRFRLCGRPYKEHLLIWLWFYGEFPSKELDHRDGDGENNCISNLRNDTHAINMKNQKKRSNNKTGVHGVYYRKDRGTYCAQVTVDYKVTTIGSFPTLEAATLAREAYIAAHPELGFTERHGK